MRLARHGFTLIEMMAVVAILGIMSSLAVASITAMARTGRVNGAVASLARIMTTARQRAITDRCNYVLQINGRTYNPPADPNVVTQANVALLYRKADCSLAGAGPFVASEVNPLLSDKLVASYQLSEFIVELEVPAAVVPAGRLLTQSVSFGWNQLGQRGMWADDDGDGVSELGPIGGGDTLVIVRAMPATTAEPLRNLNVPTAGTAVAQ